MGTFLLIQRFFLRKRIAEQGILFPEVKSAMKGVQAYAKSHGGNIELIGVSDDGIVRVKLHGACKACPLAGVTLKLGVERQLRLAVPGIKKVVQL